jgi:hypothetical protein
MSSSDRNLLFGILALQMDFISRDALIDAMYTWVKDKAQPLGRILVDQGHLKPQHLALLEPLVQAHIEAHNNDPQQSLASLSSVSSVRDQLAAISDDQLQQSLLGVGGAAELPARRTQALRGEAGASESQARPRPSRYAQEHGQPGQQLRRLGPAR